MNNEIDDTERYWRTLRDSNIPWKTLDACAALVHEWTNDDEPDARVLVVKIAKLLAAAK